MPNSKYEVLVCGGGGCQSSGCQAVAEAMRVNVQKEGLTDQVKVTLTGCMGPCSQGPIVMIRPDGVMYQKLTPADCTRIVTHHLKQGEILHDLLYTPVSEIPQPIHVKDLPFFARQVKVALRNSGEIDPTKIDSYLQRDGYKALRQTLTKMTPAQVVEVVKASGLRGRGGGGYPTGRKWELTAASPGPTKYVVCNADEGDPGAFMDRSILEGDPHSVVEAMAIAGYAIGAEKGYVYVRAEYPMAVEQLDNAIKQARERGHLGESIYGTNFSFDLEIRIGAGAFVCGEETALFRSIEGKRGEPTPKPPFPAESGLWQKPTLNNNVETYACIAPIILKGAEWFRSMGTEKSPGTKVFALAGKVNLTGLVEVPMGVTLGELIFDIGDGIPGGKKFKAAQTGGPSGGCIPAANLNAPADYESLVALGTIMGSGGLIVMDEETCMVDLARFFLEFVRDESCGKCTPCRDGIRVMMSILDRIVQGQGQEGDIELLIELGEQIKATALCGLGQTAPNPVLNTIRYFREEYEEHIRDKHCRASVCASLFTAPCSNACPAGVDVPRYIALIRERRYAEAIAVIKERNPFPAICGRVCHHPCEARCRRAAIDDPLAVRTLKRFAADYELKSQGIPHEYLAPKNGKQVAVIGAGPGGLTAAYYLNKWGYTVRVYEQQLAPGGMLLQGIPEHRLPRDIIQQEIKAIQKMGVTIKTNTRIGEDITMEELYKTYDAVFVGVGTQNSASLNIPGDDLDGVIHGMEFLRALHLWRLGEQSIGRHVVVIGGGNVAIDAARCALRKGAQEVTILYRRTRADMPADPLEVEEAEKEGIRFIFMANPVRILGEGGAVTGVEYTPMKPGAFDKSGRRITEPIPGLVETLSADTVVPAIGLSPDFAGLTERPELAVRGNVLQVDPRTLATNVPGIFAGGDCVTGADTVIGTIAAGRQAALAINRYLGGPEITEGESVRVSAHQPNEGLLPRLEVALLAVQERCGNCQEVELGISEQQALKEAARCLRCDVRS